MCDMSDFDQPGAAPTPWEEADRPAIAIDGAAFDALSGELSDPRLAYVALALAGRFCPGGIGAFTPDWQRMSAALRGGFPEALVAPRQLQRRRGELRRFFTVLPDGRWAPSARVFATPGTAAAGHNA
jgi:hypothetical protein